jgi:hypothetical protein
MSEKGPAHFKMKTIASTNYYYCQLDAHSFCVVEFFLAGKGISFPLKKNDRAESAT